MKIAEERLTRLSTFIGKYDLLPLNQDILQFLEDIEESNSVTLYEMMVLYLKIAALSNKLKEDELSETQVETVCQINKNEFMHQEFVKKKLKQVKECIEGNNKMKFVLNLIKIFILILKRSKNFYFL